MPATPTLADWTGLAFAQYALAMSAGETILRRSLLMGQGAMTALEATSMVMEKPAAFAEAWQNAALATVRGRPPVAVMTEFLKPITKAASSNAKRLRR